MKKYSQIRTKFYVELCKLKNLRSAWDHVQARISSSKNEKMKGKAEHFYKNLEQSLATLREQLRQHTFQFSSEATPIKKKDKKSERPVVNLNTVEGRIVQKCLLDILQNHAKMQKYFNCDASYGGLRKKNVAMAVKTIYCSLRDKGHIFAKATDIKSFFTKIKSDSVLNRIAEFCHDDDFMKLLKNAIQLEVSNLDTIKDREDLYYQYIYTEEGVPQGSCLSPLFGNIYLYDLDLKMLSNSNITYLRYIDDVIILGKTKEDVEKAFLEQLVPDLEALGLGISVNKTTKDCVNLAKNCIEYLGVDISKCRIKPTQKAFNKIKTEIRNLLTDALNDKAIKRKSFFETLNTVNGKITGWSHHYSFCHAKNEFNALDAEIDKEMFAFFNKYQEKIKNSSAAECRQRLGIKRSMDIIDQKNKNDIIKKYKEDALTKK